MSNTPTISFDRVTKVYGLPTSVGRSVKDIVLHFPTWLREKATLGTYTALNNVSFDIMPGEFFGIVGGNGAGKSTTLGLMAGVMRPSLGAVRTVGRICPLLELGTGFHPDLSGRENVMLNGILMGLTRREMKQKINTIIEYTELPANFIDQPIRVYSSGMVMRLAFSVLAHLDPNILLIDEGLAVGDEHFQRKCLQTLTDFQNRGVTIVLVTHGLGIVQERCSRAAFLERGNLVTLGDPKEVVEACREHLHHTAAAAAAAIATAPAVA